MASKRKWSGRNSLSAAGVATGLRRPREPRRTALRDKLVLAALVSAFVMIYFMFFYGLKLADRVRSLERQVDMQSERIFDEKKEIDFLSAFLGRADFQRPPTDSPSSERGAPSPDSAAILKNFVASGRGSSDPAPSNALIGLLDGLVKAGAVTASEADDLRKKIQEVTLDGAKEITVETAKGLIDRFIKPHEDKPSSDATTGTTINNYCWAPSANSARIIRHSGPKKDPNPPSALSCSKG